MNDPRFTQPSAVPGLDLESLEIDLLLEAAYRRWGYDFRDYARATVRRRVNALMQSTNLTSISAMIPVLLREQELFLRLVGALSVTVTELFRDPNFYKSIRENVVPPLETYAFFKVWHAGCATGEEAYSMAILLEEAGLLDRAQIHATDMNQGSLKKAREAIYPLDAMNGGQANYLKSGGRGAFNDYYHARYNAAQLIPRLIDNLTFSAHNLACDAVFGEMNVIVCRNVLIYFNRQLKERVLSMFHDSLCHRGFLCLGTQETLEFSSFRDKFEVISSAQSIYRKL